MTDQTSMFTTTEHGGVQPAEEVEGVNHLTPEEVRDKSYQEVLEDLGRRQGQVLKALREAGPLTDRQIADRIGCPRSSVNGRRNELMNMGLVAYADTITDKYGSDAKRWKVPPDLFR